MTDTKDKENNNLIGTQDYIDNNFNLILSSKLEDLYGFFSENDINYKNIFKKQGYPNNDHYMHVPGQHNTDKWLQAVKDLYYKEKENNNRVSAIKDVTSGWKLNETYDFLNWLRFYEESAHLKYKAAQVWYENGSPGYFLHIKKDNNQADDIKPVSQEFPNAKDSISDELSASQKKIIIQKQRNKIIGRLDSLEKLLRSDEGHLFAGKELEYLIQTIYDLKKKIQLINKITTSSKTYDDMIVREANILTKKGYLKSAKLLNSFAEDSATPAPSTTNPASPDPPNQSSGAPGSPIQQTGVNGPDAPGNNIPGGLQGFLQGLKPSSDILEVDDKLDADDNLEAHDDIDNLNINYLSLSDSDELYVDELDLYKNAQALPPLPLKPVVNPKSAPAPISPPSPNLEPIEVEEVTGPKKSNFDEKVNSMLSSVTIDDIIIKLEDLSKIFKTREIPRQLSIVDMMLDSLGLAAYFPSLSEATNKALESNNYISTRVDDILSKLHGATTKKDMDLKGDEPGPAVINSNVGNIQENLKKEEDKDKARKELRKKQQDEELGAVDKETPEIEIEDTGEMTPAPAPIAPAPVPPKSAPVPPKV